MVPHQATRVWLPKVHRPTHTLRERCRPGHEDNDVIGAGCILYDKDVVGGVNLLCLALDLDVDEKYLWTPTKTNNNIRTSYGPSFAL